MVMASSPMLPQRSQTLSIGGCSPGFLQVSVDLGGILAFSTDHVGKKSTGGPPSADRTCARILRPSRRSSSRAFFSFFSFLPQPVLPVFLKQALLSAVPGSSLRYLRFAQWTEERRGEQEHTETESESKSENAREGEGGRGEKNKKQTSKKRSTVLQHESTQKKLGLGGVNARPGCAHLYPAVTANRLNHATIHSTNAS